MRHTGVPSRPEPCMPSHMRRGMRPYYSYSRRLERLTLTSFKNRLLILIVSLMALAQGVTIVPALASIRNAVRADSARQLTATRAMLDSTFAERTRLLRAAADVLVADFAFREVIATADKATIQSALNNHAGRVGADLAVLYAPDGQVLSATTPALARQASSGLRLPEPGVTAPFAVVGGRPYQIVFAPLRAPEIIAWVALGFELDRALAAKLAALGGTEVSFIYHEPGAFNGYTSTLEPAIAGELAALSLHRPSESAPALMMLNDQEFLTLSAPLRSQVGGLELVVQRSQIAAMAQFRDIRFALLLIGGAALLGAIIVAWLTGRSAVRPLGVLVNAASQIERGYYNDHIQLQGAKEFQQLAGTFNSMQEGIREREARILRQATHDTLTSLLNREGLRERLAALEHHGACSVALLDVHRFRDINASVGHQGADQLRPLTALPAAGQHDRSRGGRPRGAAALVASDARQHLARGIHTPGGAGLGAAGPVALGAGGGDRAARPVAARRPGSGCRREPLRGGFCGRWPARPRAGPAARAPGARDAPGAPGHRECDHARAATGRAGDAPAAHGGRPFPAG